MLLHIVFILSEIATCCIGSEVESALEHECPSPFGFPKPDPIGDEVMVDGGSGGTDSPPLSILINGEFLA